MTEEIPERDPAGYGFDTAGVTCVDCGARFVRDRYYGNYCPDCRREGGDE
jgi:hypothetical protein